MNNERAITKGPSAVERWGIFAIVSAIFFFINGSTFTSFGVVLPFMIEDLSWSWTNAGLGFTLLALSTGLASMFPAWTLRTFGIKATFGFGGVLMALGFGLLALTHGLTRYFVGTSLLGIGFALSATVPAVFVLNNWMPDKRSFVIGAYMTIGGLGGVAGPLVVTGILGATGSWRVHWWVMTIMILLLALLAVILVKSAPEQIPDAQYKAIQERQSGRVLQTTSNWRYRDVLRCRQYYVIVAAMAITLFCTVTMSTWAVIHMGTLGISTTVAAGALSAQAAVNSVSRLFGGVLATRIDPKWLLVSALVAGIGGMLALSVADNMVAITLFAIGEGYAFGMCYFATIVLLVNYFGPRENPEILGTLNLITTIAMLGPVFAGYVGDMMGSFTMVFQGYAVLVLVMLVITTRMQAPRYEVADKG